MESALVPTFFDTYNDTGNKHGFNLSLLMFADALKGIVNTEIKQAHILDYDP